MAILPQPYLFSWKDCKDLGDLERFQLVIANMPDQHLIDQLKKERGTGRNDNPVEAMWNSILAGIVYEHPSIESLRRELSRNAQLREMCGFNPLLGHEAVPSKSAYSRFLVTLIRKQELIDDMFNQLVRSVQQELPDLGKKIAFDGKALPSLSPGAAKEGGKDRRSESDADWGVKKYKGVKQDGTPWEKVKSWFGFRLHLIVDANYELPIAFDVTKASISEQPTIRDLFDRLADLHPELVETCEYAMGDRGYDSVETINKLWSEYAIKPIIDIRKMWKDKETRLLDSGKHENITYDQDGTVFCHCPVSGEISRMAYGGFEKDRESQKFLCPAMHYGITCPGAKQCPLFNKSLRIPLNENRRIFTQVARCSYKWKTLYKTRTSVERVNSRLDVSFGFEKHYIRGLSKMKLWSGLALSVMLAIALGRIRQKQTDLMRSLIRAA